MREFETIEAYVKRGGVIRKVPRGESGIEPMSANEAHGLVIYGKKLKTNKTGETECKREI
jgi:hypothetical protein